MVMWSMESIVTNAVQPYSFSICHFFRNVSIHQHFEIDLCSPEYYALRVFSHIVSQFVSTSDSTIISLSELMMPVLFVCIASTSVCGSAAAILCYKRRGGQVPGAWADPGARDGLHQAESTHQSVLNAQPGRSQHSQLQPQPPGLPNDGL